MFGHRAICRRTAGCLFGTLILGVAVSMAPATAGEQAPGGATFAPGAPIATASLASDAEAIAPGVPFTVAVRLQLPAGWHTYWINPGEAGAPTNVEWRLPDRFTADAIAWPTPERIVDGTIVSYGYWGDVWLTTRVTPPAALTVGSSASITASVDWLACAEICVPEQAALSLTLPVAATARPAAPEVVRAFAAAAERMPRPAGAAITAETAGANLIIGADALADAGKPVVGATFFPTFFGLIDDSAPQRLEQTPTGVRLILTRPATGAPPAAVEGVLVVERPEGGRIGYRVEVPLRS